MKPLSSKSQNHQASNLSKSQIKLQKHEAKILKRAEDFIKLTKGIFGSKRDILTALIYKLDPEQPIPDMTMVEKVAFHKKFTELSDAHDVAIRESKSHKNRLEFENLIIALMIKEGLGEHFDEFSAIAGESISTNILVEVLIEKRDGFNRPVMRTRPLAEPVLPASTSSSGSSPITTTDTPNPFGLPPGTPTIIEQVTYLSPTATSVQFAPTSAQSRQSVSTQGMSSVPHHPQQPPQPSQPNPVSGGVFPEPFDSMPATPPQFHHRQPSSTVMSPPGVFPSSSVSGVSTELSTNALATVFDALDLVMQRGFNTLGRVILIKYLLTDMMPKQATNESQRQFNEQFLSVTQDIAALRNNINPSEQRLWNDKLALEIASRGLSPKIKDALTKLLDRTGASREDIAKRFDKINSILSVPPQPQPQPSQPNPVSGGVFPEPFDSMPETPPQFHHRQPSSTVMSPPGVLPSSSVSGVSTELSTNALATVFNVLDLVLLRRFNRDGYLILFQYLLADQMPEQPTNESQRQFDEHFLEFTHTIAKYRDTVNSAEHPVWNEKLTLAIVSQVFGKDLHDALVRQMNANSSNSEYIANWLEINLPQ